MIARLRRNWRGVALVALVVALAAVALALAIERETSAQKAVDRARSELLRQCIYLRDGAVQANARAVYSLQLGEAVVGNSRASIRTLDGSIGDALAQGDIATARRLFQNEQKFKAVIDRVVKAKARVHTRPLITCPGGNP